MELKMEMVDMSLDEYIAMSNISNNSICSSNKNERTVDGNDSKFCRRRGNIDDEEEEDEDMLLKSDEDEAKDEVDTGIWKGPDASVDYIDCHNQQNDLREKLNNSSNNKKHNEVSSVQYRLMAPNNSSARPRGIPTLLPLDAYVDNQYKNGGNKNYHNRNRRNRRNRGFNNNFNNHNNRNYNNHNNNNGQYNNKNNNNQYNNNNRMGLGGVNNGRIQRNRSQELGNNAHLSLNGNVNFNDLRGGIPQETTKNLVIEFPSNSINLEPGCLLKPSLQVPHSAPQTEQQRNRSMPIGNLTPQAQAAMNLNTNPNPVPNSSNDNLKSLLGFQGNVSGEMMPVFASRLLEFLQNGAQAPVHKPIYDMKIQKDIHEIQNKPLLYKCNGGEVISSDGAGVNCEIIPRTSGVSLNCRFA